MRKMTNCIECKEDKEFMYYDGEHDDLCIDCHLEMFSECYKCSKFFPDDKVEFQYIEDEKEKRLVCDVCRNGGGN